MLLDYSSLKRPAGLPTVSNAGNSASSDTMAALERDVNKLLIHDTNVVTEADVLARALYMRALMARINELERYGTAPVDGQAKETATLRAALKKDTIELRQVTTWLREAMAERSPTSVFLTGGTTTLHATIATFQTDASTAGIDDLQRDTSKLRQETTKLCH